jgi:photosystem II stability/assembly factor-like uncharacterized protein
LTGNLSSLAVSPDYANDRTLLATTASDGALHVSTDGGDTWTPGGLALGGAEDHLLAFSPTFSSDRIILAASSAGPGLYRSADGGGTWSPVGRFDPAAAYLGGLAGGSIFDLAVAPAAAYDAAAFVGTSTGVYRSNDRGVHWYPANRGLARLTVRALAAAPGNPQVLPQRGALLLAGASFFEHMRADSAAAVEFDGSLHLSADAGRTWQAVLGGLERVQEVAFSPDFARDRTAFAATGALGQHGYGDGGVYRSADGGLSWSEVFGDRICEALALSPDFLNDRTLWISAFTYSSALGIHVSRNGGDTWSPLAPAVHAQVIVPSPGYALDRTLYAGTLDAGLYRSTDAGQSWQVVLAHPVTALAVSPAYGASQTVYAGVRQTYGAPGQVYRSTDGGASWQALDTGIPATRAGQPLTISTLGFASDGSPLAGVYYGNEAGGGGVYRSTDGGQTWALAGAGLEAYNVFALAGLPAGSMAFYVPLAGYFAGTNGGLWRLDVPQGGPAEPGAWASYGPRGGMAQALAVSPDFARDGIAFAGEWRAGRYADQTGLGFFKSADAGQTWGLSDAGTEQILYSSAVHAFAFSPAFAADRTIFAATWGGLFKSTDAGATWRWVNRLYSGPPGSITALAVAPDYPASGHVLAGGGWGGVFVSRDGGRRWTANSAVSAAAAVAYSPDFARDRVAFAAGNGLYRSPDAGASWAQVLSAPLGALAVSPGFASDATLFAGGDALYTSHDGGTSWARAALGPETRFITALAISPAYPADGTLFAGDNTGLYRSDDAGLTWARQAAYPGLAVQSLAIAPGWPAQPVLLVGTAFGVYRTADGGASWALTQGMSRLPASTLALAADESRLLAGTPTHGVFDSPNAGATWSPLGLSTGVLDLAASPAYPADGTLFATTSAGAGLAIYRTTDAGRAWVPLKSTDYPGGHLAISPGYPADRTLYVTGQHGQVLRSSNAGDSWAPVGGYPPGVSGLEAWPVALPPDYPADSTLFAGGQGFWRLPPGAATWERAVSGLGPEVRVTSLAVSPAYPADRTLLATGRWSTTPGGALYDGVFRSTDGGAHWEPAGRGLPQVELKQVAFAPGYPADPAVYLISIHDLYRSLDGGLSWTAVGAPQRPIAFSDLVANRRGDVYVASDLGVWRYHTSARNVVVDGGFEGEGGWELPQTPQPAGYSSRVVYAGARSMRVGVDDGPNAVAYSSARQVVAIPDDISQATLSATIYPVAGVSATTLQSQVYPDNLALDGAGPVYPAAGDAQYLLLLDPDTGAILDVLFWTLSNAQAWQPLSFDLTGYAGRSLKLHFGVYNDGAGGRAGMYVDDVALVLRRPGAEIVYLPAIFKEHHDPLPPAVEQVSIAGPATGTAGLTYTFSAAAGPGTAALPITYAWQASGQPPVTHTAGLSDSIDYAWAITGVQIITLTARNGGGGATATYTVTIQNPIP